ncbi:MAG: TetR/AcrR family transcriptional regulator [Tannerella sp.]|jgi:AcrR family transcriptional regulator|nr:TetR/AcrR family transcriptional regulator [Tannerella sp.]
MTNEVQTAERDRQATEKRLINTIGAMIAESGFEKIGVNAVATRAGVSKILLYRYFNSIEGLMAAYIQQHDFWLNFPHCLPRRARLPEFIKRMFRAQIDQLRDNPTLRRLYRWELSSSNEMTTRLRELREQAGMRLITKVCRLTRAEKSRVAAFAALVTASTTYLAMLEEFCPVYNGIRLDEKSGWEQIAQAVDILVDQWFVSL